MPPYPPTYLRVAVHRSLPLRDGVAGLHILRAHRVQHALHARRGRAAGGAPPAAGGNVIVHAWRASTGERGACVPRRSASATHHPSPRTSFAHSIRQSTNASGAGAMHALAGRVARDPATVGAPRCPSSPLPRPPRRVRQKLGVLVFTTTLSQREAARGAFITAAGGPRPWHTHVSRLSRAPARARVPALGRPVRILPGLACIPPPCLSCCRGAGGRWSLQAARLWGAALPLALVSPVVCRPGHVRHGGALCVAGRSKLWLARERSN